MTSARAAAGALAAVALAASLAAGWTAHAAAEERTRVGAAVNALLAESPALLAISPDGGRLLLRVSRREGFELRVAPRGGGALARLAWPAKPVLAAWRPDGGAVAFLADRDGDQAYRPYLWEVGTGRVRALEAPPTRVPEALVWDPGGVALAYLAAPGPGARVLYAVDAAGAAPAREVLRHLAPRTGVAWSPDGRRLAAARLRPRGEVAVAEPGGAAVRAFAARGAEVRDLAWRPDGGALLAVLRPAGAEHFQLAEADLGTGTLRTFAAPAADVSAPRHLPGGGIVFHVNRDSEREPVACSRDGTRCRSLGDSATSTDVLALSPSGDSAYLVVRGRAAPPSWVARALDGSGERALHPAVPGPPGTEGERVEIRGRDGLALPAYVWRAPRRAGRTPAAVVRVHGGPAVQAARSWDASVQHLVDQGIDVILLNYRGSTGYGAAFEHARGGGARRVEDVLAARDHAVEAMGVPPDRVFLYGHSYGALLAARAAARDPTVAGVVLVSVAEDGEGTGHPSPSASRRPRVLLFHGENDPLPPRRAREVTEALLGPRALREPGGSIRVLRREGHTFQRVETWAEVYAAVSRLAEEP